MNNNINLSGSSSLNTQLLSRANSLANAPSHFLLEAIEQGKEEGIINFAEEEFDRLDHQEVMQKFPTLVKSLTHSMLSVDASSRAAILLRKILYRILTQHPELLNETAETSIKSALDILEDNSPLRLEFLMIQEFIQAARSSCETSVCFENICQRMTQEGLINDSQLPESAKKTQKALYNFFKTQQEAQATTEETLQNFIHLETEKLKRLQATAFEAQQIAKKWETQVIQEPSPDNIKEWKEKILLASVEQAVVDFRQEICQPAKTQEKLKEIVTLFLNRQRTSPQQIEQALDHLSQTLHKNFQHKQLTILEEKHTDLCCPLTHKLIQNPVLAQDGFTYEKEAIEKHFETSDTSPKMGEKIGKRLIPNVMVKKLLDKLKEKLKNKSKKRKISFNPDMPPAKKQILNAVSPVTSSPLLFASCNSDPASSNPSQHLLATQLDNQSSQTQMTLENTIPDEVSSPQSPQIEMTLENTLPDEVKLSKTQVSLLNLIQSHPNNANAYFKLGATLPADGSIKLLNGTPTTKQGLYLKALELDPKNANAYFNLGVTLPADGSIKLLNGTPMTKQGLYLKALELDPNKAKVYFNLGVSLPHNGSIKLLNGITMTEQDLFLKVIQLDPNNMNAYYNLATTIPAHGSVKLLNGTTMTVQQLYLKALELDPNKANTYYNLATILPKKGCVTLLNGTRMTKQELYLKALELDPTNIKVYVNLTTTFPDKGRVTLLNGTIMTQQELYLKALEINPNEALAYNNLAITLPAKGTIKLLNGTTMTEQQLYLKAIELDPNYTFAYNNLAITLPSKGSIKLLNGTTMTEQELYLKAIELDPNYTRAYYNLGITLPAKGSIKLFNGTTMTKQLLLSKGKKSP